MKKVLLVAILVASVLLSGCSTKAEPEQNNETAHFDFTASEIVKYLDEWLIDFTPIAVVDSEDGTEKIAAYTSSDGAFTIDVENDYVFTHYRIVYDDTTNEVSSIAFDIEKDSGNATVRLFYHLTCIAEFIDEDEELDNITEDIINPNKELDGVYIGECLTVTAWDIADYYTIYITPTTK